MTNETDEGNDTVKIKEDSKHKQFFEKGLGALLSDPNFLLLYVPENGAKMQVIRPASDSYHRRRMIRRINEAEGIPSFYYALSHLWGITPDNRHYWNDISKHVIDEDGQPMKPVSMRPEKRDTLLAMLKDHPDSYWWIDVLCARTDTPLGIMGDIYAYCLECIAMIDCEPSLISQLHRMGDFEEEHIQYRSNDIVAAMQCFDQCCQFNASMYTLIQSRWWERVWTWQEMALPFGEVRLMAETGPHKPISSMITMDELVRSYDGTVRAMKYIRSLSKDMKRLVRENEAKRFSNGSTIWSLTVHIRSKETRAARAYNRDRIQAENKVNYFLDLLETFGYCLRRCMDPVDYVYGVLGIFQLEIPRMDNPDAVWKLFLSEMHKLLGSFGEGGSTFRISNRAYQVDLRKANNMADVYRDFLEYSHLPLHKTPRSIIMQALHSQSRE